MWIVSISLFLFMYGFGIWKLTFWVIGCLKLRSQTVIWETKTPILMSMRDKALMEALYQWRSQSQRQGQGLVWFLVLLSIFWRQSTNDSINRSPVSPILLMNLLSLLLFSIEFWSFWCCGVEQNQGLRESQFSSFWVTRNQKILDWLLYESSSMICLQVIFMYPFALFFWWISEFLSKLNKVNLLVSVQLYVLNSPLCCKIRSSGLEMKNLWICTWRGLVMLAIVPSSLPELTTVEMVCCYLKSVPLTFVSIFGHIGLLWYWCFCS